jgi:hypothetical protein
MLSRDNDATGPVKGKCSAARIIAAEIVAI